MSRPTSLSPSELRAVVRALDHLKGVDLAIWTLDETAALSRAEVKIRARLASKPEAAKADHD